MCGMKRCAIEGCERPQVARGWCGRHYERWKRTGDPTRLQRFPTKDALGNPIICYVANCGQPSRNKGLCRVHYSRLQARGTTDYVGKENEGASRHPLYQRWKAAKQRGCVAEWYVFADFVACVGEPPWFMAQLRKVRNDEPLGPDNWQWSPPKRKPKNGQWKRPASKLYHLKNERKLRGNMLRYRFGISVEDYEKMSAEQLGCCRICGTKPERRLAVDHCHSSGKIRGLLCSPCNTALGSFKDDIVRLRRAVLYLEEHQENEDGRTVGNLPTL